MHVIHAAQYFMTYVPKGEWNLLYTVQQSISILNYHAVTLVDREITVINILDSMVEELSTCRFLLESHQLDQCCMAQVSVDTP